MSVHRRLITRPFDPRDQYPITMSKSVSRLYIIGAGASVPYRLPTLKTLTWELAQTLGKTDRELLARIVYECFGVTLRARKHSIDFEELLNRLDTSAFEYLADTPLGGSNALRRRAGRLVLAALRRFIRDRCRAASTRKGPYDRLVASLDNRAAIVSFNWDVLLEMAFRRAGKQFAYLPTSSPADVTVLLKPHGSINWFALLDRELLAIDRGGNLEVFGGNLSYYLLYLKNPIGRLDWGSSGHFARMALAPVPAFVPPGASRLLSVGGAPRDAFVENGHAQAMKAIWRTFNALVESAPEIVVIGYSIPGTDAASVEMLRHWAGLRGRRRLMLVDPNPSLAGRYRALLNTTVDVVCNDFRTFDPQVTHPTGRHSVAR